MLDAITHCHGSAGANCCAWGACAAVTASQRVGCESLGADLGTQTQLGGYTLNPGSTPVNPCKSPIPAGEWRRMDIDIFDEGLKTCKICAYQIKEPIFTNTNINEMRFKEKAVKKMINIEKWSRSRIKHFNLKLFSCSVCNCSMTQAHYYKISIRKQRSIKEI